MNISLAKLDEMREEAARLSLLSRTCDPVIVDDVRSTLEAVERKIDEIIMNRLRHRMCPFCCGPVVPATTKGVRLCIDCGATLLQGRK